MNQNQSIKSPIQATPLAAKRNQSPDAQEPVAAHCNIDLGQLTLAMLTANVMKQGNALNLVAAQGEQILDRLEMVEESVWANRAILLEAIAAATKAIVAKPATKSRRARKKASSNQRAGKRT